MPLFTPIELCPAVQKYSWGKNGNSSLVARLTGQTTNEAFAELWLGTHPDGEVRVLPGKTLLADFLAQHNLPSLTFLFKVLSVGDALSIQVHPTKEQAQKLHSANPKYYPDENAKPEASVALTPVELLYGFRSAIQLRECVNKTKELAQLLTPQELKSASDDSLSEQDFISMLFSAVMHSSKEKLQRASGELKSRLEQQSQPLTAAEQWICKLQPRYPADPGIFCFLLLNFVQLQPGQSLFIAPGVVHAYLSGDMLECMANSNNVVRAGLTPKFCDLENLLAIANLSQQSVSLTKPLPQSQWQTFQYPADEFTISLLSSPAEFSEEKNNSAQIWLCLENTKGVLLAGNAEYELSPGKSYLIPASLGSYTVNLSAGQVARAMTRFSETI